MLQRAAAALAEMSAGGLAAPGPGGEPFDDPAFPSSAPTDAEPRPNPVAGRGKGQEHVFAVVVGDAVSPSSEPLDHEGDEVAYCLGHHRLFTPIGAANILTGSHPYVVSNLTHLHI